MAEQLQEGIDIDERAAEKVLEMVGERGEIGLRIGVIGGGCAGFQYRLALDRAADEDSSFESNGIQIIVDPVSLGFVRGSTIIYVEDPEQLGAAGFDVDNPRAEAACGCGKSFCFSD